jgi:hypothetical protein
MKHTKEITKKLLAFLKTNFISNRVVPYSRFSTPCSTFLTQILELMFEAHSIVSTMDIKVKHIEDDDKNAIPKSYDHNYIPSTILHKIQSMKKAAYLYTFTLRHKKGNTKEYQVALIYPTEKENTYTEKLCKERVNKIIMWLYIANLFASHECSQQMNIFMYFIDAEKILPTTNKVIRQEHANTAFTTSCKKVTEINLYREEEWFKVFIHETFHNLGLDFSAMTENLSKKCILSIFPVESDVNLFETYCETWAEIMNTLFISFFLYCVKGDKGDKGSLGKIPTILHKTEQLLHVERTFSLFQCVKVLHFFGLTYKELYEKTEKSQRVRDLKFKEKRTNVLSYYILKSIYLFNMNDFVEWCIHHNKDSIDFKKDEPTVAEYCKFIREHYNAEPFLRSMNKFETWFQENNTCDIECSTMRMTAIEATI